MPKYLVGSEEDLEERILNRSLLSFQPGLSSWWQVPALDSEETMSAFLKHS